MSDTGHRQEPSLVLVADDDVMFRILARESLENKGFVVEEAEHGAHALASFVRVRPDIVLLDVHMPEMDGFAVCAKLRKMPFGESIPLVMVTGAVDVESIDRAYEVGATDFITKPINWGLLHHRVRYILRAGRTREALRTSEARLANAQRVARLGSWDLHLHTQEFHWSDELCRIFGFPPQTAGSLDTLLRSTEPNERERIAKVRHKALVERTPCSIDYTIRLATGEQRIVDEHIDVIRDARGRPIRMSGTVQDITERKQSEEALRKAKETAEAAK